MVTTEIMSPITFPAISQSTNYFVLPLFQIIGRVAFSRYIAFAMHLDIQPMHLEKVKTTYNLKRM